jgi:conjugative relaxase-like TrwC/TraI family protein
MSVRDLGLDASGRMLTIGKLGASPGQLEYYERQVAAGAEDYYAGRGESPGVWLGTGVAALGLAAGSRVERQGFMALMRGCDPADGSVLRPMTKASTVAAVDLTFSAPKSVSVLFAVAGGDVSQALAEAHERAVASAVAYLEREACRTRRGRGGVERVSGEGFVAASYRHRLSRAGDPQLHTHVVVANLTRADGRFTALDAHTLYEHKSAAGAVYRAALRAEVRDRMPWVSWQRVGRGLFEIDGVPEGVLRHFSQRRAEIEERAAELVGAEAAGSLSRERMQGIALATRRPKSHDGIDGGQWRANARARSAEHGFGPTDLAQLRARRPADPVRPSFQTVAARLSGQNGLTATHNTFTRRHAVAELAGEFTDGIRLSALEGATDRYLEHSSVRPLPSTEAGAARFTTEDLLTCERAILDGAHRRRRSGTAVSPDHDIAAALARSQPVLNADQAAAVRAITTTGNGVDTVQALAGTGKTTMMRALADAYRDAGYTVIGAAPTARAARELREVAGVPAETLHALAAKLDSTNGFREKTVLLLDEAGMASTRISAEIFKRAERAGVKVIAVGDPGQLTSVQAGGWLAALTRQHAGPELRRVLRQHDPAERDALEALHDGNPETYLDHKADQITIHATETDAIAGVIDQWADARAEHGGTVVAMIARDNATRDQLNCAARERLKIDGALPDRGVIIGGREWAPGDRIITRRNSRQLNVDNGTLATITGFDRQCRAVLIRTDGGEERAIDASYLANYVEYAYAITGHSSQGATVENAIVVGRPEEFTREWAYTALSRARHQTTIHLIADHGPAERDRRGYAPPQPDREPADALDALAHAMRRSEAELLAVEHPELDPPSVTTGGGQPHDPTPSPSPARSAGWASRESTRSWRPQDPSSRTSLGR